MNLAILLFTGNCAVSGFFLATENNTAINVFVAVNLDALIFVQ